MKNAIVVFTKVPKAGDIKTRLTIDRGGMLTPEEAKDVYEACLLDVIDSCIFANCGDIYICYNRGGDEDYLRKLLQRVSKPQEIKELFPDQGGIFDQCIQYAADYVLRDGKLERLADSLLIIGGDLPSLQPYIIQNAMIKMIELSLSNRGRAAAQKEDGDIGAALVEASCQEGGFSIVGFTCTTPFDFNHVFYNNDGITALDMLVQKAIDKNIPLGVIEMVPDLDIPVDLASHIPVIRALRLAEEYDSNVISPKRTIKVLLEDLGLESIAAPPQR
ncbi:MAG TPA: DUF2064 domain-containing protein [Syntrophomonadaceae bacterium]|nr:DUF2064 domain-containing protein [Syntrophomonadaceae bacterium]